MDDRLDKITEELAGIDTFFQRYGSSGSSDQRTQETIGRLQTSIRLLSDEVRELRDRG
jgi:hypothetical protein